MKFLLTFSACLYFLNSLAQFVPPDFNRDVQGTILTAGGQVQNVTIFYEHPDFLKLHDRPLRISGGPVNKNTLKAFALGGNCWVLRPTANGPQWTILKRQGAIEMYDFLKSDSQGKNNSSFLFTSVISKGDLRYTESELVLSYKAKVTPMVADYPELAAKVGEDGYGITHLQKVVDEYNDWFEKNRPSALTYLPAAFGVKIPGKEEIKITSVQDFKDQIKASQAESAADYAKKLDELFPPRPLTVPAAFASAKDNQPGKKESFPAKMQRIQADGNKIGVAFILHPVRVNPPEAHTTATGMSTPVTINGEINESSLRGFGEELTKELNAALKTTSIELIDLGNVPYREVKLFGAANRIDDWWVTKYKVVFVYTIDPWIKAVRENFGGETKFSAYLNFTSSVMVTEYIGGPTSNKQDVLGHVLNMGAFMTPTLSQPEDILDLRTLYDKLIALQGMSLAEKARSERVDGIAKVVKKLQ